MKFLVAQIGARRGYAVPAILEGAGMLERFYTDMTGDVGVTKWLARSGSQFGLNGALGRLASRRLPESIRTRTSTFLAPSLRHTCRLAFSSASPSGRFREHLRWSTDLGHVMIERGFGSATHVFSMLGECGPLLVEAKRRGLAVVSEVYILLSTERIVTAERRSFPDWEPPQPDPNGIRKEFLDEAAFLAHTDCAICPSAAVQDDLEANFGFTRGRSAIVPYGMDPKWLELTPRPQRGRVLFVGTAELRKGIHYLAMAAEKLRSQGCSYEFRIAGNVSSRIAGLRPCRHLTFLGRIPRHQIQEEFAVADVFVLPSLAEGSAEATYEALAAGLPVITTNAAGSVVRDGRDGCIIPERDPERLALAIQQVVEDRSLRDGMAIAARERARDYTWELYGKLLDQPIAEIPDMDSHSLIQFHIHVPAARHLGTVISMLRKSRNRHDLAELAKIERL